MSGNSGLTISKLAKSADVNVETIRYYQRVGIIEQPQKPEQGYRQYSQKIVTRVKFIKRAQRLGFALREISELLELDDEQYQGTKQLAQQKLTLIEENIADLFAMKATLNKLINSNRNNPLVDNVEDSTIVNALVQ